jgi:hypothetical protein
MACSSRLRLSRCHQEGCNAPGETAPCYVTTLPCKGSLPKLPSPQQRHSATQIVPGPGCDRVKGLLDLQSLPAVVGGFPCIVSPRRRFLGCEMVQGSQSCAERHWLRGHDCVEASVGPAIEKGGPYYHLGAMIDTGVPSVRWVD